MQRWILLGTAACGSPDGTGDVHTWSTGDGVACIHEYQMGSFQVVVDFQELIECWSRDAFTCDVVVDGENVRVTAGGSMDMSTCGPGGTVTSAVVRCDPIPIPSGTYTLAYGDDDVVVDIPLPDGGETCTGPM